MVANGAMLCCLEGEQDILLAAQSEMRASWMVGARVSDGNPLPAPLA